MTVEMIINGRRIIAGRRIVVSNGRVECDGTDVTPDAKNIRIEVHGNVASLDADFCALIHVTGDVGSIKTASGDVRCGGVSGSISTMSGDVVK